MQIILALGVPAPGVYRRIWSASCWEAAPACRRARYKNWRYGLALSSDSRNQACWVEVWLNTISSTMRMRVHAPGRPARQSHPACRTPGRWRCNSPRRSRYPPAGRCKTASARWRQYRGFSAAAAASAAQIAGAAAGRVLKNFLGKSDDDPVLPPVRKGIHNAFLQMRRAQLRQMKLNNLQRALMELTLVNHGGERHRDDDRDGHRLPNKHLPEGGLNGENTRQATNARAVRHHAVETTHQTRQTRARSWRRASKRISDLIPYISPVR